MLLLIAKEDGWMKGVTLEAIYKKVVHLERDVGKIKKKSYEGT